MKSPTLHGDADVLNQHDEDFKAHVTRSVSLLRVYVNDKLAEATLTKHLRESFYPISKDAEVGGTANDYAPRK